MIFFLINWRGIWTPLSQAKTSAWDADMLPPHHEEIANEQSIFYRGQDLLLYRLIWAGYYYLVSLCLGSNHTMHLINPNRPVCILCNISGQNSCQRWHFTGHCRFRELIMWWRNSPSLAKGKIKYMNQIQPTDPQVKRGCHLLVI